MIEMKSQCLQRQSIAANNGRTQLARVENELTSSRESKLVTCSNNTIYTCIDHVIIHVALQSYGGIMEPMFCDLRGADGDLTPGPAP